MAWERGDGSEKMGTVEDTFCCFGRHLLALGEEVAVGRGEERGGAAQHAIRIM